MGRWMWCCELTLGQFSVLCCWVLRCVVRGVCVVARGYRAVYGVVPVCANDSAWQAILVRVNLKLKFRMHAACELSLCI